MPIEVKGAERVDARMRAMIAKVARNPRVTVGYSDPKALFVHELVGMKLQGLPRPSGIGVYWGPHGQAKFLEAPARSGNREMRAIVEDGLARGLTLGQALLRAGLWLQGESMKLVPVEYGDLKRSAFTRVEEG